MASLIPSLIPDPEDLSWIDQNIEILDHLIETNIETPPVSVFQVPETITTKKPEAYQPQQLGLGPIHHLMRRPYMKMEQKKFAVVRSVLQEYSIENYKDVVFDNIEKLVPVLRSCYDVFLQGNDDSLAWIFGVDGLFLLNMFHTYNSDIEKEKEAYLRFLKRKASESETRKTQEIVVTLESRMVWEGMLQLPHHQFELPKVGPKKRLLAQDMMMVENQIPYKLLKVIDQALYSSSGNSSHLAITSSPATSMYRTFCKVHSPLKLCSRSQAPANVDHLLHYMYSSIIKNVAVKKTDEDEHGLTVLVGSGEIVSQAWNFFTAIPRTEIVQAYEQTVSVLETFTKTKILIPSASTLYDTSGFRFHSLEDDQGIQNIRIDRKDIYLPQLTLNIDSEVILRNLVAYETLTSDNSNSYPLTEYMGLMCALIVSVDDVKSLGNVIKGDLGASEVVKLFKSMTESIPTMKTRDKSKLQYLIEQVNEVYNTSLRMKSYLLLKKLATWFLVVLKSIGGFVESSWKIVAFMVSIVTVFILTRQAYCNVYGCDKTSVTLSSYASS